MGVKFLIIIGGGEGVGLFPPFEWDYQKSKINSVCLNSSLKFFYGGEFHLRVFWVFMARGVGVVSTF